MHLVGGRLGAALRADLHLANRTGCIERVEHLAESEVALALHPAPAGRHHGDLRRVADDAEFGHHTLRTVRRGCLGEAREEVKFDGRSSLGVAAVKRRGGAEAALQRSSLPVHRFAPDEAAAAPRVLHQSGIVVVGCPIRGRDANREGGKGGLIGAARRAHFAAVCSEHAEAERCEADLDPGATARHRRIVGGRERDVGARVLSRALRAVGAAARITRASCIGRRRAVADAAVSGAGRGLLILATGGEQQQERNQGADLHRLPPSRQ